MHTCLTNAGYAQNYSSEHTSHFCKALFEFATDNYIIAGFKISAMSTIGKVSGSVNDRSLDYQPTMELAGCVYTIPSYRFCRLAGIIEPNNSEDNYTTTDDDNDSILSRTNCIPKRFMNKRFSI